ncbi:DUF6689 family protein [Lysobacter terrae]
MKLSAVAWTAVLSLCLVAPDASAQLLGHAVNQTGQLLAQTTSTVNGLIPVAVTASGDHAEIRVGNTLLPLAEVSLDFQDASGLTPASLGATAQLVNLLDETLLARLPDTGLTQLTSALPLLLTIEPPANGGLSFRDTGRMEIHTHLLPYTAGSPLRVFKASLGAPFRDVTDEIARGSVRARTTYGGFSQFLILVDLRSTRTVIDQKLVWMRGIAAQLPAAEQAPFQALIDDVETNVDADQYASALTGIDAIRTRAQERAGIYLPNEWRATHDSQNLAGELVAAANTLGFSVRYLRDFGQ